VALRFICSQALITVSHFPVLSSDSIINPGTIATDAGCENILRALLDPANSADLSDEHRLALKAGDALFEQNESGGAVFVLVSGELSVRIRTALTSAAEDAAETEVNRLLPGAIVGEMSALTDSTRSASVYALSDASLIRIEAARFREVISLDPEFRRVVTEMVYRRWRPSALNEVLVARFGASDTGLLESIQQAAQWHHLPAGEALFQQGEDSDRMYIVVSGRLRLDVQVSAFYSAESEQPDVATRALGYVSAGETIGEFGLITGSARSATVVAMRESNLVSLSAEAFNELMERYPSFSRAVLQIVIERQLRADPSSEHNSAFNYAVAIVGCDKHLPTADFAAQLADCWPEEKKLLLLDSQRFDQLFGQSGASQSTPADAINPSVTTCMSRLESHYQTIIYIADSEDSAWTRRCLNQVDEVLMVADPQADGGLAHAAQMQQTIPTHVPRRLALWHAPHTQCPSNTNRWLDALTVSAHHHVRRDDREHMQRLARHLAGEAVCLVLSGGGARGVAHAGVYRAMMEQNIPIDCIGGTSVGALASGTIAIGMSYDELLDVLGKRSNPRSVMDYTLPITSLLKSDKVNRILQDLFGDTQIEDLWLPLFCVSTNLTHSELQVHDRGLLWRAVRASMSIPGVFTPVMEGGDMLVDGGVLNNFPIDVMKDRTASGNIIAVNLGIKRLSERPWDLDASVSGWRILSNKLNPFSSKLAAPTITKTMMRTVTAASDKASRECQTLASLIIKPEARTAGMLDFSDYQGVADAGHTAALEPLREWRKNRAGLLSHL
jgi:predicted acylesterase/phospholipase RssA/CRP-like cAMP-binding protein